MDNLPFINNNNQKGLFQSNSPNSPNSPNSQNMQNIRNQSPKYKLELKPKFEQEPIFDLDSKQKRIYMDNTYDPDWIPDFTEKINIEAESIGLALNVLGLSKAEYNYMSIKQLKEYKTIDCSSSHIFAYNILIHYKQNSKNKLFPNFQPIQHSQNKVFDIKEQIHL